MAILQPNCRSVGKLPYFNEKVNPQTWKRHYDEDLPRIEYCGQVALTQLSLRRHFIREQPEGTRMDEIKQWKQVQAHEKSLNIIVDQCMAGQQDEHGTPVLKRTEFTASDEALLYPLSKFVCDGRHTHATPCSKSLERLKLYPLPLCNAIAQGVLRLKRKMEGPYTSAYPNVGTDPVAADPGDVVPVDHGNVVPAQADQNVDANVPLRGCGCAACNASLRAQSPNTHQKGRQLQIPIP